jgi:hypothetical protein
MKKGAPPSRRALFFDSSRLSPVSELSGQSAMNLISADGYNRNRMKRWLLSIVAVIAAERIQPLE